MRWPYRVDCLLLTIILSQQEPYVHAEEFKQVKHIGKGQYGDVWKMEHAKLPCMIAVKKIVLNTSLNEKERRRWKREIEVLRKSVDHPHTVTFYGALVHNVSLKYIQIYKYQLDIATAHQFVNLGIQCTFSRVCIL